MEGAYSTPILSRPRWDLSLVEFLVCHDRSVGRGGIGAFQTSVIVFGLVALARAGAAADSTGGGTSST